MSLDSALARVAELNAAFMPPQSAPPTSPAQKAAFAGALKQALNGGGSSVTAMSATTAALVGTAGAPSRAGAVERGGGGAAGLLAAARGEIGQTEQPPGSNDSRRIAEYRHATAGNPGPGPWCAYFVSWCARRAGMPLGEHGQGFGSVDELNSWAHRAGRAMPPSATPRPGDLIIFHEHIGIVESVSGGTIHTIEGNTSDSVARRVHGRGEAIGFVRMGH